MGRWWGGGGPGPAQCCGDTRSVNMSPASGVLVLLLCAGAGLSQDQESLLSHRSYVYTTASCLQESCCSLAARVDINTTLDSELRHKQYLFVMR